MQRWILQQLGRPTRTQVVLFSLSLVLGSVAVDSTARGQTSTRRNRPAAAPVQAPSDSSPSLSSPALSSPAKSGPIRDLSAKRSGTTASISVDPRVAQWIEKGLALETESRWVDAVSHYEEAIKEFPENPKIRDRWNLARAHCDVSRRHADGDYLRWARSVSQDEAVGAYLEILQKIQSNYVARRLGASLLAKAAGSFWLASKKRVSFQANALKTALARSRLFATSLAA